MYLKERVLKSLWEGPLKRQERTQRKSSGGQQKYNSSRKVSQFDQGSHMEAVKSCQMRDILKLELAEFAGIRYGMYERDRS